MAFLRSLALRQAVEARLNSSAQASGEEACAGAAAIAVASAAVANRGLRMRTCHFLSGLNGAHSTEGLCQFRYSPDIYQK